MINHPPLLQKAFIRRDIAIVSSKDSFSGAKFAIIVVAILIIWLTLVILTTTRHEFWRDEVRALSLVRAANSPLDLFRLTKYEGHPILWYLILYIGNSIANTPLVLPVTSILIALAAVTVFLFFSPFPFWLRCMFIFSIPRYEYSVMARNYGISMLLIFVVATLYRNRAKYPLTLAFILALLANTNIHSAILSCLIMVLWIWDMVVEQRILSVQMRGVSFYLPFVIVFAGVLLCVVSTLPSENTIVSSVYSVDIRELSNSLFYAVLQPGQTFSYIAPSELSLSLASVLLYLAVFGLLHRPNLFLAALGGQIAFGMFFRVVYFGGYRHQGLFLIFILFLYWLFIESRNKGAITKTKRLLFNIGFFAVIVLIIWNIFTTTKAVQVDTNLERSSSKAFGGFLNTSATYRDAIIVPEPDYLLESLPYYSKNMIYLPREHRFGTTTSFTTDANYYLSLGELLSVARDIKTRYGRPVLIVLGHLDVSKNSSGEKEFSYNKAFSWNTQEYKVFNDSTILVAKFSRALGDENYMVYTIR